MDKLGLVIAVVGLLVGGYALMESGGKQAELEALRTANRDLTDRLYTLEAQVADGDGALEAPEPRTADAIVVGHASDGTPVGLRGRPTTARERLAALEKRVAAQDEALAKIEAEKADEANALSKARGAMRDWSNDRFYGNLDMAAKSMGLSERQKADMQDLMDRAKQELDDLYAIQNDEGVTWAEVRKPKMVESNGFSIAMPDMAKLQKFKQGRIPGSSETFGEAEKRIRGAAFGRMRSVLTGEQAKKWDKAHKDALLRGGSGGAAAISFVSMGSDD